MPAKRSSNAHKKAPSPESAGIANDLVGVLIIFVAIAMIVSLVSPSTAVVTHAVGQGLRLGFGEGAILVPVAMILFAITMFLPCDAALVGRVAGGLALIVVAALSMLSILIPGADAAPDLVIAAEKAAGAGGYVGSGVAWVLLTYLGQPVGIVILIGCIVCGCVVCGFSISNLVERIRRSMGLAAERIAEARETHDTRRRERADAAAEAAMMDAPENETAVLDEPETSFVGARRTSVLRRGSKTTRMDHQTGTRSFDIDDAPAEQAKTSFLGRKRHPKLDIKDAKPAEELPVLDARATLDAANEDPSLWETPFEMPEAPSKRARKGAPKEAAATTDSEPAEPASAKAEAEKPADPAVPDFLRNAAGKSASAAAAVATSAAADGEKPHPGRGSRKAQAAAPASPTRPGDTSDDFTLPPMSLLNSNPNSASSASTDSELERTAQRLQSTLQEFGLTSRVSGWTAGPLVTTFKIEMGEGERVNKITNLQDDIQLSLASESVRIFAPIPGTSLVGIEIPNKKRQNVCLGDVLPYAQGGPLEFAIGRDSEGSPVVADLARMPHMLVAGTTGSGKSVLINAIIMSLIMRTTPEQVRLILVDPKRVEFSCYAGLPHLYVPVVTEPRQAASALQWAVTEMDRRLKVFERASARDVKVYNRMVEDGKFADMENPPRPMPYLVIVIDELSDLMMVAGKDVEASIVRIAQLARAAGIHLVLATQRPSADVVTGLIKSNVDTRVALKVSSSIDSRVILDQTGAERLMGRGDMLFRKAGGVLRRVLGAYASDDEIESVVSFIRDQREPDYHDEILSAVAPAQQGSAATADDMDEDDPLVWEAAQVVVDSQLGSTSGLQRRLKVGYARAGRIMDNLERKGVVGPPDGSKPREVLLDADGLEELRAAEAAYREV